MSTAVKEPEAEAPGLVQLVGKYIQLRDKKSELEAAHKARKAKIDTILNRIEAALLEQFKEDGIDSVRTAAGTAYVNTKTQVSVADWDETLEFIKKNDAWSMLERRVSKGAVEAWQEEYEEIPPGLNIRQETTVNVRRSA